MSVVERVCHGQERAADKFFYMYMCHFSQLHVRLRLDDFAMGMLRLLNVVPTQLHLNSRAYLQAFRVLCQSLGWVIVLKGAKGSESREVEGFAKEGRQVCKRKSYLGEGEGRMERGEKEVGDLEGSLFGFRNEA